MVTLEGQHFFDGLCVQDVVWTEPAPLCGCNSIGQVLKIFGVVRVRADNDADTRLPGFPAEHVVQVQTVIMGIDLQTGAGPGRFRHDRVEIQLE